MAITIELLNELITEALQIENKLPASGADPVEHRRVVLLRRALLTFAAASEHLIPWCKGPVESQPSIGQLNPPADGPAIS